MITDPGISNKQPAGTYPPYDDGMTTGIFINASGTQDVRTHKRGVAC